MDPLLLIIIAIIAIAAATAIAPKLNVAGPLILVLLGLGVSLLPFVPPIEVDPEIILVGVLPPLLYSAAVSLPAIEFRRDFGPIAGLSVLLVVISSVVLAFFFVAVIPGLPFVLALALGAILSPTDAVATSIVKRLGISPRVVTMLEGESLLNDATSLVLLRVAIASVAAGSISAGDLVGSFAWGVVIAVVIGAIIGYLNLRLRALVRHSAANTAVGFIVPFAAYLPTEHLGGSGLVAAVVAGIVTGQGAVRWFTPEQRMSDTLNWRTIELVLEGAVFLLMGLELKDILQSNMERDAGILQGPVLAITALGIVLAVRAVYVSILVWVQGRQARGRQHERLQQISDHLDGVVAARDTGNAPPAPPHAQRRMSAMRRRVRRAFADLAYYQSAPLSWKHGTVLVWAGMRGVVTLAAAQTLPRETTERELLIFVAFLVAVGSLMLQGFTIPWVVTLLKLDRGDENVIDRDEQRRLDDELRDAAASALAAPGLTRGDGTAFSPEFVDRVGARLDEQANNELQSKAREMLELRILIIEAQRRRLDEVSSGGEYSTPALRSALAELDADELSFRLRLDDQE